MVCPTKANSIGLKGDFAVEAPHAIVEKHDEPAAIHRHHRPDAVQWRIGRPAKQQHECALAGMETRFEILTGKVSELTDRVTRLGERRVRR